MLKHFFPMLVVMLVGFGSEQSIANTVTNTQPLNEGINFLILPTGGGTSFQDIFSFVITQGSSAGSFAAGGLAGGGAQISSVGLYDLSAGNTSVGSTTFSSLAFGGLASGLSMGSYEFIVRGSSVSGGGGLAGFAVVSSVPEPSEWAMLIAGLGIITVVASRRRRDLN